MPPKFENMHIRAFVEERRGAPPPRPSESFLAQKRESNVTGVWLPRVKIMNEIEAAAANARKLTLGKATLSLPACLSRRISCWLLLDRERREVGVRGE